MEGDPGIQIFAPSRADMAGLFPQPFGLARLIAVKPMSRFLVVITGLVPVIHAFFGHGGGTWVAGTCPAMTADAGVSVLYYRSSCAHISTARPGDPRIQTSRS